MEYKYKPTNIIQYIFLMFFIVVSMSTSFAQQPIGGIGSFDGSSTPRQLIWLEGDALGLSDGNDILTWNDLTGNGNDFTTTSPFSPIFKNATPVNGHAYANFSKDNNRIVLNPFADMPDTEITTMIVYKTTDSSDGLLSYAVTGSDNEFLLFNNGNLATYVKGPNYGSGASYNSGNWQILSHTWRSSDGRLRYFRNGSQTASTTHESGVSITSGGSLAIGGEQDGVNSGYSSAQDFDGDIAEVIMYNSVLNDAQRIIVENYLGEKYALGLSANDIFGNLGTYSTSYFEDYTGIGSVDGSVKETESTSDALIIREYNGTLDANEFIAFAHDNTAHADGLTSDITVDPGILDSHWARGWYVEVSQSGVVDGGDVSADLSFDFSVAGLTYSGSPADYVLLFRDDLSADYDRIYVDDVTVENGDQVVFTVPSDRMKSGYYTIGKGTQPTSKTWYVFQDGNWSDHTTWTLDASTAPIFINPGSDIPGTQDQVIIRSGKSVTVQGTTNNITVNSIVVSGNLYLTTSDGHDFTTINGNGQIVIQGNSGSENFPQGTTSGNIGFGDKDNGGTLLIAGSGDMSLDNARVFRNVLINRTNNTDKVILAEDYTINGNLTIRNGQLEFGDGTANARSMQIEGDILVEDNGSTRIGSITTATANVQHIFDIKGDFTNNGQVYFTNRPDFSTSEDRYDPTDTYYTTADNTGTVETIFSNDIQDQVVDCNNTTFFSRIVIDKGVDETYTLFLQTTDSAYFRLLGRANYNVDADISNASQNLNAFAPVNGTVKLDNNIIIPVLNTVSNYAIPSTSRVWIDGGYLAKTSGVAIVPYGKIEITEGTFISDVGSGVTLRGAGKLKIDGGIVRLKALRTSTQGVSAQGTYEQNGGDVLIAGGSGVSGAYALFSLTYPGNVFIMTGGQLTIQGRDNLGTGGTRGTVFINSDPENQQVTGGTVIFESNTTTAFKVTSRAPFYSVTMRASIAAAGDITLEQTTSGTGGGDNTQTLAAQNLIVINDLIINGYNDNFYDNPLGNFPIVFAPVTSATNVNDVYIGGSFYAGRNSSYVPIFGGTPNYDGIGNEPTEVNTTYFNQTMGTSAIDTVYYGITPGAGQLELGSFVLDRESGNELRTIARTGNNGSIRFDVNGDMSVLSGTLDQNAYTFRIWGSITNNDRLGTYYASGSYPDTGGTPSEAQIRFRENPPLTITTTDDAIFGNIRFNVGAGTTVTFDSDVYIERLEYLNGRIYLKNHTLTVDQIWNINNGGGNLFNGDVANTSILDINNSGAVGNITVMTDGKASDGGLKLKITGNTSAEDENSRVNNISPITFPVGFTTDGGVSTSNMYTRPAQLKVDNYADDGYIQINVVSGELQTTDLSGGEILEHYWRVRHSDFTTLPKVAFRFYYRSVDNGTGVDLISGSATEADYVPGYVLDEGAFTRHFESDPTEDKSDIVTSTYDSNVKYITVNGNSTSGDFTNGSFAGFDLINANFTTGVKARFIGAPEFYYTNAWYQDWSNTSIWHKGSKLGSTGEVPVAGSIVYIYREGPSNQGRIWGNGIANAPAKIFFEHDYGQFPDAHSENVPRLQFSNPGSYSLGDVSGTGMISVDAPDAITLNGDFGEFADNSDSYYLFFGGAATVNNIPTPIPNLMFEGSAKTIDQNIEVNYDFILQGGITVTPIQDIRINQDLVLGFWSGGTLRFPATGSSITVDIKRNIDFTQDPLGNLGDRNITIENSNSSLEHNLKVAKDIIHGSGNAWNFDLYSASDRPKVILELQTDSIGRYYRTSSYAPNLYRIVMNKGTSQSSTFTFEDDFNLLGPTSGAGIPNALEMKNGFLILDDSDIDIDLTTGGDFDIPPSAGLEISLGKASISGDDAGMILDGSLIISGGELDMATGVGNGNNFIEYSASGNASIEVTDGLLTVGAQVRRSTTSTSGVLKYTQTGGVATFGSLVAPVNDRGVFEILNTGSEFNLDIDPLSGDGFTIVRDNNSTTIASLRLSPDAFSISDVSVITLGNTDTPAAQNDLGIHADIPIKGLHVADGDITAKIYGVPLIVDELEITSSAVFDANGFDMTINSLLQNDGTYMTSGNSSNGQTTFFPSGGASDILGSGTTDFWNFEKSGAGTLTLSKDITVDNNATLNGGVLDTDASAFNLKKDLLHNATHTSDAAGPGIIFNGPQQQNLDRSGPGTSYFGVVNLDNTAGLKIADTEEDFQIDEKLVLTTGVLDIGGNLLIFPVGAGIENGAGGSSVTDFNKNRMIQTNSSIRDFGVRKFFPATTSGSINFTYPVGLNTYTPVVMDLTDISAGQITVRPVADIPPIAEDDEFDPPTCTDPDLVDANNVLQYYWILKSSSISGLQGSMKMYYDPFDIKVESADYTVANYGPARLYNQDNSWDKVFTAGDFDEIANTINFPLANNDNATLEGIYTAGVTLRNDGTTLLCGAAIPDIVPQFITLEQNSSGDVFVDGSYQAGVAPNPGSSFDLIIKPGFNLTYDVNSVRTRKVTIEAGATLEVASGTNNHNLGFVTGEGNVKLVSNTTSLSFPTGDYDQFFPDANCTNGGGLEFSGTGSYSVLSGLPRVRNVIFSGSGDRTLPNNHSLLVCEDLEILGSVELIVPDGNNNTVVKRNIYKSDISSFDNGGGSSTIVLNGSERQYIRGDFTSNNAFNNLEVDNADGMSVVNGNNGARGISADVDVDVEGSLLFSNGLIFTDEDNDLRLRLGGTLSGYGTSRYVNGPFIRELPNNTQVYDFPVGDGWRYGYMYLENPGLGASPKDWTVRYYNSVATNHSVVDNMTPTDAMLIPRISGNEYWVINDGTASTADARALVGLSWDGNSEVSPDATERQDLTVMEWNDAISSWDSKGGKSHTGTATFGTLSSDQNIDYYEAVVTLGSQIVNNPLPVELVSFNGMEKDGKIELRWETASELNNDYFTIEHSIDGRDFVPIGNVDGNGTSTVKQVYSFLHQRPAYPNNYYRLRQVDYDGAFEYSDVIVVRLNQLTDQEQLDFVMYPNPTSGNSIKILLAGADFSSNMDIQVLNLSGTIIHQQGYRAEELQDELELDFGFDTVRGIYLVKLIQDNGSIVKKLILK